MSYSSVLKGNNLNRLWCLIDNKAADISDIITVFLFHLGENATKAVYCCVVSPTLLSVLFRQSPIDLTHSLHSDYEPPKLLVKNIQNMTKKVW